MKIMERMSARAKDAGGNRPILIVCLGDSVTHGCFELPEISTQLLESSCRPWEGFPMKLQRKLTELYPRAAPTVLNAGVGGDNVEQMAKRLDRDVLAFQPDLVVFEVGLNDCPGYQSAADVARFGEQTGKIMDQILACGAELILLTPNAMCARLHEQAPKDEAWRGFYERVVQLQTGGVMTQYVAEAKRQAQLRGVPVADAYARWESMRSHGVDITSLLANRVNHPMPQMHDLFVEEIVRAMQLN